MLRHGILSSTYQPTISISVDGSLILTFITEASTNAFDPAFTVGSGILNWNLGDASTSVDGNAFSHTYAGGGNKTVKVYQGTTDGSTDVDTINMPSDDLVGTLDVSGLTGLGGAFYVYGNSNLTSILNPTSSETFSYYYAYNCDLTGVLDCSGLTGLGGNFRVNSNPNLTSILNPDSSQAFTYYYAYECDLTGVLDVSGLTGLGGSFQVRNNGNLTQILNPESSEVFTGYAAYGCDLTGVLDVSGLSGLGGTFSANNNSNLTSILNPTSSEIFSVYYANNCDLTGVLDVSGLTNLGGIFYAQNNSNLEDILLPTISQQFTLFDADDCSLGLYTVDDIFSKMNTWYTANAPTAALTIDLGGGTNMPPTDGASNADILNLEIIFDGASKALTITINE